MKKEKIFVILPTLPFYRREFFENLDAELIQTSSLKVVYGSNNTKKILSDNKSFDNLDIEGQKVLSFRFFNLTLSWQVGLIRYVLKNKPHKIVIMLHTGRINQLILLLIYIFINKKYIIWGSCYQRVELNERINKLKHGLKFFFERRSFRYIVYGHKAKRYLITNGYNAENIFVAQNTINVEKIVQRNKEKEISRNEKTQLLYVGALTKTKRLETLINSLKNTTQKYKNLHLNIIGGGPHKEILEKLVLDLNLIDFITFRGPLFGDELANYFIFSDIYILPGTGGLAVNEAMAYSNIILSTEGDGTISDLIINDYNGQFLDSNVSDAELKKVLTKFLDLPRLKIDQMKQNSQDLVFEKASFSNMLTKFKEALSF